MVTKHPRKHPRPGVDEHGRTSLHYAASQGSAKKCADLLAGGANPNASDDSGWTPLHFAAQAQSAEVASLLLNAGAAIDARDRFGNTPLWRATMNSRGDGVVIALLRRAGADPYAQNDSGISPVGLARTISNFQIAQFYSDLPVGT